MTLHARIKSFWRKWHSSSAGYLEVTFVSSMSDVPDHIDKTIFIVGSTPKWVIFDCPCDRGHRLSVPLMKSVSPHWRLTRHGKTISLWPSISVTDGPCDSHFWLRKNRVEWARWVDYDYRDQTKSRLRQSKSIR